MLKLQHLTKVYNQGKQKIVALDDLNCTFNDTGLVIILGKSGCGKSTLINMIGGLDNTTSGQIICNNTDITCIKGKKQDAYRNTYVGIVFQDFHLIEDISVHDNIDLALKLNHTSDSALKIEEALSMVGLTDLGYRKPGELSGGQRQRVAIARALVKKPEIILADEPTGELDGVTSEEVFECLKKLSETKLVIVVTHNKDLAYLYGDRILHMVDGKFTLDEENCTTDAITNINDKVLAVSSTANLTTQKINEKLNNLDDTDKYIGISYNKDRVALAYSDDVDAFYQKADVSKFTTTEQKEVTTDKTYNAVSSNIKIKDCVHLARENIKRNKRRYRFLTALSVICMMCLTIAIIVSTISIPGLVSSSAFKSGGKLIKVTKPRMFPYNMRYLNKDEISFIDSSFNGNKTLTKSIALKPVFKDKVGYNPYSSTVTARYEFEQFNNCIENASPVDFGFSLIQGSTLPTAKDEIIISDLASQELMNMGFLGIDNNGDEKIMYLDKIDDLIGKKVKMQQTNSYFTICGIFDSGASNYRDIDGLNLSDKKVLNRYNEFTANREFIYSTIFGYEGTLKHIIDQSNHTFTIDIEVSNGNNNINIYEPYDSLYQDRIMGNTYYDSQGISQNITALNDNEIYLSYFQFRYLINFDNEYADINELVNSEEYKQKFPDKVHIYAKINYGNNDSNVDDDFIIKGIVDTPNHNISLSDNTLNVFTDNLTNFDSVLIYATSQHNIKQGYKALKKYNVLKENDVIFAGSSMMDAANACDLQNIINILKLSFFCIAIFFGIFAFLVILSYMNQSIKYRTKEIGVLRVIGANRLDIAKIFLTEGGLLAFNITLFTYLVCLILLPIINTMASIIFMSMQIKFNVLSFNLISMILIAILSIAFVFISIIIPVHNIVKRTPVEAMKMGGNN